MRSSIFGSKSLALVYAKVLVGTCAILVIAFEILADYVVKHNSGTYVRVSHQYAEAVKVRPSKPGEPASVLMMGNSLLMQGVDVDRLQDLTSSRMRIYPILLEATSYYDWLYGLRRQFRLGARPQVVIVGVGAYNFLENSVRQEYSPMMLFDLRDVLGVASDLRLDRTATSNLLLAHSSTFWDMRSVIRTQILHRAVPHLEDLFLLVNSKRSIPLPPESEAIAISRLQTLRELCEAHKAKLIILVLPVPSSESAVRLVAMASTKARVNALVPIDPATLSARFYSGDAIHLNSEGEALFTSALATVLPEKVLVRDTVDSPDKKSHHGSLHWSKF